MKNNDPKISIVIPVYNGSDYVAEAIDSALNQTYENTEIVIVNDGSNDEGATKKIIERYVREYPGKIKYFEKENGGVSTALNVALEKMTGDYFSWLSHDDRYYPYKLEKQVEYLKDFDENTILYSDYDLMDSYSEVFATSKFDHEELMRNKEYALLRGAINGITLLIPKKAFDVCGNFDVELRCTQDYDLWLKMMLNGFVFVHQSEVLATTRLHKDQTTNTSPRVISEGDPLWIDIISSFSEAKRIELDGSTYAYYLGMKKFLETSPYAGALQFVEEKLSEESAKTAEYRKHAKVSVVIPFYNCFEDVKRAIESVLRQTHQSFEIVLVNDGSENAEEALAEYLGDERIRLVNVGENKGVANARNLGMTEATGDYIAFLDSDDTFLENKLEMQLEFMVNHGAKFSYTSYVKNVNGILEKVNCDMSSDMKNECIGNCLISTSTVMISKWFVDKYNLKYNTSLQYGEDVCFYLDILRCTNICYLNEYLTSVTIDESSVSQNSDKLICALKNILGHALSVEEYCNETPAIARLCCRIVSNVLSDEVVIVPVASLHTIAPKENFLKRAWRGYREKGLVYFLKRPFRGLNVKTKRYYKALKQNGIGYCFKRVCHKFGYICVVIGRKLKIKK